MRRFVSIVILISMTLHCFSRLGVLSYIYENRASIAFTLGIIEEIPIAMCSQDYDFNPTLHIDHTDADKSLPPHFITAPEINLFFQNTLFEINSSGGLNNEPGFNILMCVEYPEPSFAIFHPPALA